MRTPRFYSADEIKNWDVSSPDANGFFLEMFETHVVSGNQY